MLLLSKIDANLLKFGKEALIDNAINLFLGDATPTGKRTNFVDTFGSAYSNSFGLSNNEYLCYHFSEDYSVLTLYSIGTLENGRPIVLYLPGPSMNEQHTFIIQEIDEKISINMILKDGSFLLISLPLSFVCSQSKKEIEEKWFDVLNPYDFTVRIPHLLHAVSSELFIVFLDDGGLLGLRRSAYSYFEPILFNDNSYLQSITQIFSKRKSTRSERVVSCCVYLEKYLIVLTQNCHLKVWDLTSYSLIQDINLAKDNFSEATANRSYEGPGCYLKLSGDYLVIYLPFGNGIFQMNELETDGKGKMIFKKRSVVPTNLSSSSVWSLVDLAVIKPLDLNLNSSFLNIVVLWKSGCISKLQILNLADSDMQIHEWVESINRSLNDIESEQDLKVNGDTEKGYANLKARYSAELFHEAQRILSENNIVILAGEPQTMDYLANLETVLRDLKGRSDEVSSLTIFRDGLIVANCVHKYNHSVFVINSTLENAYYNIHNEYNEDDLTRYLKSLHGFSTTLSRQVLLNCADKFIAMVSGEIPVSQSLNEKFTDVFKSCLESNFEMSNLKLLLGELNSLDIIALLNDFVDHHIQDFTARADDFIEAIRMDNFSSVTIMESLYQVITIQRHFVLQILVSFVFLDFDPSIFAKQINRLLELHFKQSLILSLYKIDLGLVTKELFDRTTKFESGIQLGSYSQWRGYLNYSLLNIYDSTLSMNPFFIKFFDLYVCGFQVNNDQKLVANTLLKSVGWPFYIRDDKVEEFMLAMMLFVCDCHSQAFEFFQLHDYTEALPESLPQCINELLETSNTSIWKPLISSLNLPHRHSSYFYELSVLFSHSNSVDYAFKCIKRSIKYSMGYVEIKEPKEFKQNQLKLYLDLLFHFSMFEEALDVLRFSHETLPQVIREYYFRTILESTGQGEPFFATLLKLCHSHTDSLYLPLPDYKIIDNILSSHLQDKSWISHKKLYSFRVVNNHERSAAELLFSYSQSQAGNMEDKKKCYLIIINILSTFENERDKWILKGNEIVNISDLKTELENM